MQVRIYQCNARAKFPFNILALLIKRISRTNYSHYALSYVSETGNLMYCDSTAKGVRQMNEDEFFKHYAIVKGFVCKKAIPRDSFLAWFEYYQGRSYGFKQIVGLALKIFNIVKTNPFGKGAKRIICNELVVLLLNRFYSANIKDTDSLDLNDTEQLILRLNI